VICTIWRLQFGYRHGDFFLHTTTSSKERCRYICTYVCRTVHPTGLCNIDKSFFLLLFKLNLKNVLWKLNTIGTYLLHIKYILLRQYRYCFFQICKMENISFFFLCQVMNEAKGCLITRSLSSLHRIYSILERKSLDSGSSWLCKVSKA
jgi:hypothetical protein